MDDKDPAAGPVQQNPIGELRSTLNKREETFWRERKKNTSVIWIYTVYIYAYLSR